MSSKCKRKRRKINRKMIKKPTHKNCRNKRRRLTKIERITRRWQLPLRNRPS